MKKLEFISFIILFMTTSCKGQDRVDLSTIDFNVPDLPVEEKPLIDEFSIFPPSPGNYQYQYDNMEIFCFGDFKFKNGGDPKNRLNVYLNEKRDHIISVSVELDNNEASENFVNYLTTTYGKPKILDPEPTKMKNGKPFGYASYVWKDILPNRSIVLFKSYGTHNGEWSYGITVHYAPTESVDRFKVSDIEANTFLYLILIQPLDKRYPVDKGIDGLNDYINNLPNAN